jgi:hypothetical protein
VEPIIPAPPGANGPWRLLILDRDPQDPKWILATVASPGDVRPASPTDLFTGLQHAGNWVRGLLGRPQATLTAMTRAHVWHVDEGGKSR